MASSGNINRSIDRDDVYSKLLLKMLPTEMVGVCLAVIGTIFSFTVPGGLQTTMTITIEVEGASKPACVIESISRWLH